MSKIAITTAVFAIGLSTIGCTTAFAVTKVSVPAPTPSPRPQASPTPVPITKPTPQPAAASKVTVNSVLHQQPLPI